MVINKIEIESFGKFKDFTLDLKSRTNVVYGFNEAGKSTICAFLYAMFYDLPSSKQKSSLREDYRRRYMPWSGQAMSGSIYFTHEGKKYILKRRLGKTPRSSRVQLFDGDTWEEIKGSGADNPGKTFLGIGEDGFLKTLYISQLGAQITNGREDEIIERLSNLKRSGDEDISYQKTMEKLLKKKHALISIGGGAGEIIRLENENKQLNETLLRQQQRINELKRAAVKKQEEEESKLKIKTQIKTLLEKKRLSEEHTRYSESEKAKSYYAALCEKMIEVRHELSESEKKLETFNIRRHELSAAELCEADTPRILSELETEHRLLGQRLDDCVRREEEKTKLERQRQELKDDKRSRINIMAITAAIFIAVLSSVLGIFINPWLLSLLLPAAGLFFYALEGIGASRAAKDRDKELSILIDAALKAGEEGSSIRKQYGEVGAKIDKIVKKTGTSSSEELYKKISERDNINALFEAATKENELLLGKLSDIESEAERVFGHILADGSFDEAAIEYEDISQDVLEQELSKMQSELIGCEKRLSEADTILEGFDKEEDVSVIKSEVESNLKRIDELMLYYNAVSKALELLEESYEELKSDFAPLLSRKVGEALTSLSGGKYVDVRVSDDYTISVKTENDIVDGQYLSGGTYDMLYLALRLGILNVIYDKIPLLILDDTLLQFDSGRSKSAAEHLINENADQTIYFTCHESQIDLFSDKGINIIYM